MSKEKYWQNRVSRYESFRWVNDPKYLEIFMSLVSFKRKDLILDAGIGTGFIARRISPRVGRIYGVDTSKAMLKYCNWDSNIYPIECDVRDLIFKDNLFDKVIMRNTLHHVLNGAQVALNECYRVLKKGGKLLFGERISPSTWLKDEYSELFKYKDERVIFDYFDLMHMMFTARFKIIRLCIYKMKNFSVKEWLNASGLSDEIKEKIYNQHKEASPELKKAFKMRELANDCVIEINNAILLGEK